MSDVTKYYLSILGLFVGFVIILKVIMKIVAGTGSDTSAVALLLVGVVIGSASGVSYYYFRAKIHLP